MNQSSNNRRIAKNTMFLYIRMILVLVVSLFTTRVVLSELGVEDYGIFNVVAGFVSMFAFLNTSMSNGIQRFYNFTLGRNDISKMPEIYSTAIQIQLTLAFLLFVLLETVGLWYIYNKMVIPEERLTTAIYVFQFSVVSMLLVVMQIPYSAAIIAHERMDYYAYVSVFDVLVKMAIAYALFIIKGDKLLWYGVMMLAAATLNFLLYFSYARYQFKVLRYVPKIHKHLFKPMLSFSGWNIFGSFAYVIKSQGLNLLLNVFFGPVVNASRGISNMVMSAIQGFQGNIVVAFRPQIVQAYAAGEQERVKNLFYSLSKISFILLSMLSVPVILELKFILHLWLGEVVPEYTYSFTILVLLNMIFSSLNTPVTQVVHATAKMKTYQIITSVIVFSILPFSYMFLKIDNDPNIVYWVSLVLTIINQIACNIILKNIFPYSLIEYFKLVILPCISFLILTPIIPYIIQCNFKDSFPRFLFVSFIYIIISISFSYIILLNKSERKILHGFINRKKH